MSAPGESGEVIRLMRSPIETNCGDCKVEIKFGTWCYYEPSNGNAVCIDCGTKKGWQPKNRVNLIVEKLELQEDVKALTKQRKIEMEALLCIRKELDLREIGKRDLDLEGQIIKLMGTAEEYLKSGVASKDEDKALKTVFEEIKHAQELQREIRETVHNRLFLLEKRKRKIKVQMPITAETES